MDSVNRKLLYIKIGCTIDKQEKGGMVNEDMAVLHNRKMFKSVTISKSSAKLEPKYSDTPSMVSLKHEST